MVEIMLDLNLGFSHDGDHTTPSPHGYCQLTSSKQRFPSGKSPCFQEGCPALMQFVFNRLLLFAKVRLTQQNCHVFKRRKKKGCHCYFSLLKNLVVIICSMEKLGRQFSCLEMSKYCCYQSDGDYNKVSSYLVKWKITSLPLAMVVWGQDLLKKNSRSSLKMAVEILNIKEGPLEENGQQNLW